jgi:zinc protease
MMFQGSKNASGEYFEYVEKAGANLQTGGVNGTTSNDRTNYFATVPSGNLEYLLWLESDRLATLDDAITKEKLDNQRDVVKNERRQGLENQPYGRASKLIDENVFPVGHPYHHQVIGSHEDLTAASVDDVVDFFRTYYTPNNLTLCIAGDFDIAEAKKLIEKYFGAIPPGPALDRPGTWVPTINGEKIINAMDRVPQERTYMAWPTSPGFSADEAPLDMAMSIMSDGISSRLRKALMYDRQYCSNISAYNQGLEIACELTISSTARPGVQLEDIEKVIDEEIAKMARQGPTTEELDRAKARFEYGFITGLERIGGFGGKADRLNMYNTFLGDPDYFDQDLARYRNVTPADVREAVGKYINNRNRVIVRFHPETSERPTTADIDRSILPSLGADRPFQAPDVTMETLENGLQVYVVQRPELPKVAVELATRAGSLADPQGKEGLAALTASLIPDGTKSRKALEINEQLGDLGVTLQTGASREVATVSFESLKNNLGEAMGIVSDVVRNPVFPESDFTRRRNAQLDGLMQQENNPNSLAFRIGSLLMFGREHPYGRPTNGWRSSISGLTREDVAAFHQQQWKPQGSIMVFVGDITQKEAVELAKKHFGMWSGSAPALAAIPDPKPVTGRVYLIDRQDAAQTTVMQMVPLPGRGDKDYYAITLADAVYGGGGFGTRLNLNLREDKGYTYGAFSFPWLQKNSGVWVASAGIQTDKTKPAVVEFYNELKNIGGAKPVSDAELVSAKEHQLRGRSQEYETLGQIAGHIIDLWAMGLPMAEMDNEAAQLQSVSLTDVNAAAKRYAVPDKSVLLLVGDRSKIEPGLRELNLGEIVVIDKEGRVVEQIGQK